MQARLNLLQRFYLFLHHRTFARRLAGQRRYPDARVISVGNLSAGGTGKTPATALLAGQARKRGRKPMIALRGYRGSQSKQGVLVSDGKSVLVGSDAAGDEAVLLAGKLDGVRVAAGRDRAALLDAHRDACDLILLDDAFQNPSVYRDFDLVLIDASEPVGQARVIPTGRFREDLSALKRADAVLLTRVDQATAAERGAWEQAIARTRSDLPVFATVHRPGRLEPAFPEVLHGAEADASPEKPGAFCGLGSPDSFRRTLKSVGVEPAEFRAFPDHHPFRLRDLEAVFARNSRPWVTTEKDLVRLSRLAIPAEWRARLLVLPIRLEVLEGREGEFLDLVLGPVAGKG